MLLNRERERSVQLDTDGEEYKHTHGRSACEAREGSVLDFGFLVVGLLDVTRVAANLACLRSESGSRTPFCGLTRRRFGQHLVDPAREGRLGDAGGQVAEEGRMDILLERKSFSLGNNKDSVDEAAEASRAPNKEDG